MLRARTKTTGIYETRFTMGQLSIQYVSLSYARGALLIFSTVCSMLVAKGVKEKSGSIALRMSPVSYSALHSVNTIRSFWRKATR